MNLEKTFICLLLAIPFLIPFKAISQDTEGKDTSRIFLEKVATEIIHASATCALITVDKQGHPRVRTMDPFTPEDDFIVWLATNPHSRKVAQIKNNPRVSLYYAAPDQSGYVSIYAEAELIHESVEKEKRWKEKWKDFYPHWPDDYLLIKVTPKWLELISIPHGINGDTITWEPSVILLDH